MTNIQTQIRALPDSDIKPLLNWLTEYYNGEVWDREIEADLLALGPDEFAQRLLEDKGSVRRQAFLRLFNNLRFTSEAHREECLRDLETLAKGVS